MTESFSALRGPWALVVGASDGVGAAFARAVAARGLDVVLVARRKAQLDDVADDIRSATGARARTVVADLTHPDGPETVIAGTADIDIGTVFYCAGADWDHASFLARPFEDAMTMIQRNCVAPAKLFHHYAASMTFRGRGSIVLLTSAAGLIGGPNMVAYGATKAFDLVMAEALWSELRGTGVDVLALVLGLTDTPAVRRQLLARGQIERSDQALTGATSAEQVVEVALANLSNGPTCFAGDDARLGDATFRSMERGDAVRLMATIAGGVMGHDDVDVS